MTGVRHRLLRLRLRWARWRAPPASRQGVLEGRDRFERMGDQLGHPPDAICTPDDAHGVPVEWVRTGVSDPDRVLLYLHGGAYTMGSVNASRHGLVRFARAADATGLNVDYRLTPEHPFPAALTDALTAYRWILSRGVPPGRVSVLGESAGGGLAIAMLVALRDAGTPLPAAAATVSAWADLDLCGRSYRDRVGRDLALTPAGLRLSAALYLDGHSPRDPLASPVHADLHGLPPLLLLVGSEEMTFDDSVRLAARVSEAGDDAELRVAPGMLHCWTGYVDDIRRARGDIAAVGDWLRQRTGSAM